MGTVLLLYGRRVGVATLQAWCPHVSRRALGHWLRQQRRAQRRAHAQVTWMHFARVWAVDVSQPPHPIDGVYRYLVHVRDLATPYQLAALPVARATAPAVVDLLRALVAAHGAPLVLKVDNGSPFGRVLQAWAHTAGVLVLYSPPAYPPYNGSIEASIGAITTRAHHCAAAAGHPAYWTCDDVDAARVAANLTVRPGRDGRTTAALRWQRRGAITCAERQRFHAHYVTLARSSSPASALTRVRQRTAIVHTLLTLGYVAITRRADLVH